MAITGSFTKVEIPANVQPGKQITLHVAYKGSNPGALYWSSCIMAKVGSYPVKIVTTTRELGAGAGNSGDYNLGIMPNERVTVKLRLLGHDEAGHQWIIGDWRD